MTNLNLSSFLNKEAPHHLNQTSSSFKHESSQQRTSPTILRLRLRVTVRLESKQSTTAQRRVKTTYTSLCAMRAEQTAHSHPHRPVRLQPKHLSGKRTTRVISSSFPHYQHHILVPKTSPAHLFTIPLFPIPTKDID